MWIERCRISGNDDTFKVLVMELKESYAAARPKLGLAALGPFPCKLHPPSEPTFCPIGSSSSVRVEKRVSY